MLKKLSRLGWYRGVMGGARAWSILWVVVGLLRLAKRVSGREPELVSVERLKVGQTVSVTALPPPPGRRARRRARRAARG